MKPQRVLALVAVLFAATSLFAAVSSSASTIDGIREITIAAFRPLGGLVGEWKGVGQPKRGSNAGAWSEKAQAAWHFDEKSADLVVTFEPGQQFHKASFSLAEDGKTPALILEPIKGDAIVLMRAEPVADEKTSKDAWVFESEGNALPQTRCTIRIISDIRFTMLFEEKPNEKASYRRLSEIGLTRSGSRLAKGTSGERECIVTGGLGTIKVSFEGKNYYVCCEGCQQAFDADPAGTIDAYRERLKAASEKK